MRRVTILALLALALPTVALANSFSSGFFTGTFTPSATHPSQVASGRNSSGGFNQGANPIFVVNGNLNRIRFDVTGGIVGTGCQLANGTCSFNSGHVIVTANPSNAQVFNSTAITDGVIDITGNDLDLFARITASPPGCTGLSCVPAGGGFAVMDMTLATTPLMGAGSVLGGNGFVGTPEPGTLALLGTSVIGLAGMARRRLKLGR